MEFIRKRMFWVLCGLALLIGITMFVWGSFIHSNNNKQCADIASVCNSVPALRSRGEKLTVNALQRYQENSQAAKTDAVDVKQRALASAQRPFLYDDEEKGVFPKVTADKWYHYEEFSKRYRDLIDSFIVKLNAGDRPTKDEEERAIEKLNETNQQPSTTNQYPPRSKPRRRTGTTAAGRSLSAKNQEKIREDLRKRRATEISIYANSQSFCAYDYHYNDVLRTEKDYETQLLSSWFTQIAAWIQQDVVDAIVKLNHQSETVEQAPIKRLIEISFSGDQVSEGSTDSRSGASSYRRRSASMVGRRFANSEKFLPCYVVKNKKDFISGHIATPFTNHTSNDMFDVVQFEVGVIIDTRNISDFINALQSEKVDLLTTNSDLNSLGRNQITVLDFQIEPLDLENENKAGYYYGTGSLCVLSVAAEYLFFNDKQTTYEQKKPQPIRELLEPVN